MRMIFKLEWIRKIRKPRQKKIMRIFALPISGCCIPFNISSTINLYMSPITQSILINDLYFLLLSYYNSKIER